MLPIQISADMAPLPDFKPLAVFIFKLHPLIFRELCAEQSLKSCSFHLIINAAGPCFLTRFLTTSETLVDTKERLEIPWWSSG